MNKQQALLVTSLELCHFWADRLQVTLDNGTSFLDDRTRLKSTITTHRRAEIQDTYRNEFCKKARLPFLSVPYRGVCHECVRVLRVRPMGVKYVAGIASALLEQLVAVCSGSANRKEA